MATSGDPTVRIRAAVDRLNAGDLDGYLAWFAPDCGRVLPGVEGPLPPAAVRAGLEILLRAFPDGQLHEITLFGAGRQVCAHWRFVGRHDGEYLGVAPTGRRVSVDTAEIYVFGDDGELVVSSRAFGDPADIFRQLADPTHAGAPS